jgi:hypothetical protein
VPTDWLYPDVSMAISINRMVVADEAADPLDRAGLGHALATPRTLDAGGVMLYPRLWDKAGVLLRDLATGCFFEAGNEDTAWVMAEILLAENGERLYPDAFEERDAFIPTLHPQTPVDPHIGKWLFDHRRPVKAELDDLGTCVFCERDGNLVGAELLPRDMMREWRVPEDDTPQASMYYIAGAHVVQQVSWFDRYEDLVPGVCGHCRYGWLAATRKSFDLAHDMAMGIPSAPGAADRRALAIWLMTQTLMSAVHQGTPFEPGWLHRASTRLRKTQRPPAGWGALIVHRQGYLGYNLGACAILASAVHGQSLPVENTPVQMLLTLPMRSSLFVAYWVNPDTYNLETELNKLMSELEPETFVQLWPDAGKVTWPPRARSGPLSIKLRDWLFREV